MDSSTGALVAPGRLPPGPSIGAWQALSWNRDPMKFFVRRFARYGDPFTTPFMFKERVVCTADPEGVEEIFTAPKDTFDVLGAFIFEPVVGKTSLFTIAGDRHKRDRQLLTPSFHGERMRSYGTLIVETTARHAAALKAGDSFVAHDLTQTIALEVILRAVFGLTDPEAMKAMGDALLRFIDAAKPPLLISPLLRTDLGPWSPGGKLARAGRAVDGLIAAEVARRRAAGATGEDILGMMLAARYDDGSGMGDVELRDALVTMVMAGHETTASALAWALAHLLRQPDLLARLRGELQGVSLSDLARLPFLDAVCNETLRIHPVVVDVVRRLTRPLRLRGWELPAGEAVCAATLMTHHDPRIFPEPARFRPERFLERKFTPFELYPFGGGARRCIGAAFAMFEMKLVLATLVLELDLALKSDAPLRMYQRNVAWAPHGGVPLELVAHRS